MTGTGRPKLHICVTCRTADAAPGADGASSSASGASKPPHGRILYDTLREHLSAKGNASPVELVPVVCLANCDEGCSGAISQAGKWTYLLRRLSPAISADILTYCEAYAASPTGGVLRSKRPASLSEAIGGRAPAPDQILPRMETIE